MALCFGGDWKESIKDDHPLCFGGDWVESCEDYEKEEEMTEKFTPGEWTAHLGIMEPTFVHIGKEEDYRDGKTPVICELYHGIKKKHQDSIGFDFDSSEMRSNAALIAAAPEMYRMLKYLADGIRWGGLQHTDRSLAAEIEAVLKKARGEE